MKKLLGALICIALFVPQTITVKYYLSDIPKDIFLKSIESWEFKKVKWVQVDTENKSNLVVERTEQLTDLNRNGEASHRRIKINKNKQFSEKTLINLLSHEIGHYVFLPHNNSISIMNAHANLVTSEVTVIDKNSVYFIKFRIFFAKLIGYLVDLNSL